MKKKKTIVCYKFNWKFWNILVYHFFFHTPKVIRPTPCHFKSWLRSSRYQKFWYKKIYTNTVLESECNLTGHEVESWSDFSRIEVRIRRDCDRDCGRKLAGFRQKSVHDPAGLRVQQNCDRVPDELQSKSGQSGRWWARTLQIYIYIVFRKHSTIAHPRL